MKREVRTFIVDSQVTGAAVELVSEVEAVATRVAHPVGGDALVPVAGKPVAS